MFSKSRNYTLGRPALKKSGEEDVWTIDHSRGRERDIPRFCLLSCSSSVPGSGVTRKVVRSWTRSRVCEPSCELLSMLAVMGSTGSSFIPLLLRVCDFPAEGMTDYFLCRLPLAGAPSAGAAFA